MAAPGRAAELRALARLLGASARRPAGRTAHLELKGLDRSEQERLVRDLTGIDYETLPAWQKRGVGLYIEHFEKPGVNPLTGEERMAERRRIEVDLDLPPRDEYRKRVMEIVS